MVRWQEEYQRKMISPEETVKLIKSGDRVAFAYGLEPNDLGLALLAQSGDLRNIQLYVPAPGRDFPWYEPGWEETFDINVGYILPVVRRMMEEHGIAGDASAVKVPEHIMAGYEGIIVSSDTAVIDQAEQVFDLAGYLIREKLKMAFIDLRRKN